MRVFRKEESLPDVDEVPEVDRMPEMDEDLPDIDESYPMQNDDTQLSDTSLPDADDFAKDFDFPDANEFIMSKSKCVEQKPLQKIVADEESTELSEVQSVKEENIEEIKETGVLVNITDILDLPNRAHRPKR